MSENAPLPPSPRRHDLDALRGFAMLLGILLHAALAYVGIPWPGQDSHQLGSLSLAVPAIHGFRMPLFFLLSGFFTAMLFSRRGLGGLVRHRAKRILLPLAIGMCTVVPLVWVTIIGSERWSAPVAVAAASDDVGAEPASIHEAARKGQLEWIERFIDDGADPDALDQGMGIPPIASAVLGDQAAAAELLLDRGADPNTHYRDGYTALHTSAFLGRDDIMALLIAAGGDVNIQNPNNGEPPLNSTLAPQQMTEALCRFLGVDTEFEEIAAGRERITEMLEEANAERQPIDVGEVVKGLLFSFPVFHHLWFLWFLCWMVAGFAIVVGVLRLVRLNREPGKMLSALIATPACLLVLVPLTLALQWPMHNGGQIMGFGPDTATGLLPMPHVLAFYSLFFGFGALLYTVPGGIDRVSRMWWLMLPLAIAVAVPGLMIGMQLPESLGWFESQSTRHLVSSALQAVYAWLMTFGLIGLFRVMLSRERGWVRYLSDASYWLYLAHLPVVMFGQIALTHVDLPAIPKVLILTVGSTLLLLALYQLGIRYTIIGRTLNGPRTRPVRKLAADSRPTPA